MSSPQCPKCQKEMILRKGKFGDFYGCQNYPRCKMTMPIKGVAEKKELHRIKSPSDYQTAIFEFIKSNKKHAVIKATAGSGKTTVQENGCAILLEDLGIPADDIIYLAYNAHIVKEAVEKGLPAQSTHQLGRATVKAYNGGKIELDNNKVNDIAKNLVQETWDEEKWMISSITQIVSKLKNTLAPWDNQTQEKICDKFGIEVNGSSDRIFELVRQAMEINNKNTVVTDFDDWLYLPYKFNMPVKQHKWVLCDEIQDFNKAQIELAKRAVAPGGRFIGVGDENQSMYGFRGAAPDAMQRIIEAFQAEILPLSISYRNPASHVELINRVFPHIKHEVSPFAKKGEILEMSVDKMMGLLRDGDLVICRNNAPLVEPVFTLIRQGVKAVIRGKDIGTNLVNLIERFNVKSSDELFEKLEAYRIKEVAKLLKAEKTNQAQLLTDKVETIFAIGSTCDYVWQIVQKINEVFSDKNEGVIFSSIHKAKGDEAERVFVLFPQLMPSKYAKDEESIQQEINIMFVALSRSKDLLAFVGGPAPAAFESQAMWEEDEYTQEASVENLPVILQALEVQEVIEQVTKEVPTIVKCPF